MAQFRIGDVFVLIWMKMAVQDLYSALAAVWSPRLILLKEVEGKNQYTTLTHHIYKDEPKHNDHPCLELLGLHLLPKKLLSVETWTLQDLWKFPAITGTILSAACFLQQHIPQNPVTVFFPVPVLYYIYYIIFLVILSLDINEYVKIFCIFSSI